MTFDEIVGITHCTLHETHYKGMGWPDGEKCPGASRCLTALTSCCWL